MTQVMGTASLVCAIVKVACKVVSADYDRTARSHPTDLREHDESAKSVNKSVPDTTF